MISAMVIVFREMLEMALVVGVLLAATRGIAGSRYWIGLGIVGGIVGATLFALGMEQVESSFAGDGEFMFNALLLCIASLLIAWTVFWMSRHGREMSQRMQAVGDSVREGSLPATALALVSLAAVTREGGEAVFFMFGAAQVLQDEGWVMLVGGLAGGIAALGVGALLYFGLARIPLHRLFAVASWLLMLVAAGMASQAAWNLVAINWLPPVVDTLWNSSAWLPQESLIGELLHVLIGYDEAPSGMQLIVFVVALVVMATIYQRLQAAPSRVATSS